MPNTPARVRQAVTAVAVGASAQSTDADLAEELFRGVGQVVLRIDEGMMDGFTALAGSGPAYVFFLAQAMVEAGVSMGLDHETAIKVVCQTVAGSGALLAASNQVPGELLAAVMSKGGTTEAAVAVLGRADVHGSIIRAIVAARDRGAALAGV